MVELQNEKSNKKEPQTCEEGALTSGGSQKKIRFISFILSFTKCLPKCEGVRKKRLCKDTIKLNVSVLKNV